MIEEVAQYENIYSLLVRGFKGKGLEYWRGEDIVYRVIWMEIWGGHEKRRLLYPM